MQSFFDVWETTLRLIKKNVTSVAYESWIKLLRPVKLENNVAYFYVRTLFQKGIIENNYKSEIEKDMTEVMGFPITVEIITEQEAPPRIIKQAEKNEQKFEEALDKSEEFLVGPQQKLTFDNFIVGNENKFAHAAALAVANNPAGAYNPFFLYGRSGLGKTHLLCAIANEIRANKKDATIIYIKGEEFSNELIEAIQKGKQKEFRNKYRYVDALLMDDVQFIGGKVAIQEEFFHTFESLYEAHKQIVLTSDRPPKEMLTLEDRLKTRFESGLMADIQPPEYETRVAIIRTKAENLGLDLSADVIDFVASKLKTNVRELEGAINKIKAYQILSNEKPSIAIAQNAIKSVITENIPTAVTPSIIIEHVARYYNVSIDDIQGKKRLSNILFARQIAMYITREMTDLSLPQIGAAFGGKDHSTALHSIRKIEESLSTNPKLSQNINELMENIKKSF